MTAQEMLREARNKVGDVGMLVTPKDGFKKYLSQGYFIVQENCNFMVLARRKN